VHTPGGRPGKGKFTAKGEPHQARRETAEPAPSLSARRASGHFGARSADDRAEAREAVGVVPLDEVHELLADLAPQVPGQARVGGHDERQATYLAGLEFFTGK
jgi:hypothetical protein